MRFFGIWKRFWFVFPHIMNMVVHVAYPVKPWPNTMRFEGCLCHSLSPIADLLLAIDSLLQYFLSQMFGFAVNIPKFKIRKVHALKRNQINKDICFNCCSPVCLFLWSEEYPQNGCSSKGHTTMYFYVTVMPYRTQTFLWIIISRIIHDWKIMLYQITLLT